MSAWDASAESYLYRWRRFKNISVLFINVKFEKKYERRAGNRSTLEMMFFYLSNWPSSAVDQREWEIWMCRTIFDWNVWMRTDADDRYLLLANSSRTARLGFLAIKDQMSVGFILVNVNDRAHTVFRGPSNIVE